MQHDWVRLSSVRGANRPRPRSRPGKPRPWQELGRRERARSREDREDPAEGHRSAGTARSPRPRDAPLGWLQGLLVSAESGLPMSRT